MKSKRNIATEGLSGRILQFVFSQRHGKTFVGHSPETSEDVSEAQKQVRSTFKMAATYAKGILSDPAIKTAYQQKAKPGQSAYNVALADFFRAPQIGDLDISGYNGQAGSTVVAT